MSLYFDYFGTALWDAGAGADSSTLFLVAGIQYVYVTYLGYAALPFVARSQILLSPLLPIFGGYVSPLDQVPS